MFQNTAGRWINRVSEIRPVYAFFALFVLAIPPNTLNARPLDAVLHGVYIGEREYILKKYSSMKNELLEIQSKRIKRGIITRKKAEENPFVADDLAKDMAYQLLINMMVCFERSPRPNEISIKESVKCLDVINRKSQSMMKFNFSYIELAPREILICLAKSRLLEMEVKYPPYDFLIHSDGTSTKAYDPYLFLSCIKSKL